MKMQIVDAKHIAMADVTCSGCHMIALLDTDRLCEFCRRPKAPERYSLFARLRDWVKQFSKIWRVSKPVIRD